MKLVDNALNQKIKEQWELMTQGNDIDETIVRPEIAVLWREMRHKGIDPYTNIPTHEFTKQEHQKILEDNKELCRIARPFLKNIYDSIPDASSLVNLLDKNGVCLISLVKDTPESEQHQPTAQENSYQQHMHDLNMTLRSKPETVFLHSMEILMCYRTKQPSWCIGEEHYLSYAKGWSCVAAPILDQNGEMIAIISISDQTKYSSYYSLGIALSAAKSISNELKLMDQNRRISNVVSQLSSIIETTPWGVLLIDQNGIITQSNHYAKAILHLENEGLNGHPVSTIIQDQQNTFQMNPLPSLPEQELILKTPAGLCRYYVTVKNFIYKEDHDKHWALIILKEMEYAKKFTNTNLTSSHSQFDFSDIIGESEEITEVIDIANIASRSTSTVLITGPSGTGKELFAHAIHSNSSRRSGPFVSINCGALPTGLVESELFGYEGGAFTGAKKNGQIGKFELADGGTIFLDEIGEMPLSVQASILRVLETKEVTRIGGSVTNHVDVRIIAATNRNLIEAVQEKQFREDLYYRLNVLRLELPALCERKSDIPLLADYFIENYMVRLQKKNISLSPNAYQALSNYHWPGNVRELENIIERAINLTEENTIIDEKMISKFIPQGKPAVSLMTVNSANQCYDLETAEKDLIIKALSETKGSITKSAQILGIGRRTLYRKCDEYEIDYNEYR